jgi:hypothetical protein
MLVPLYQVTQRHVQPEEGNKLLSNISNCITPHGIKSHNTLIFNTGVKTSALQRRSSKETTIRPNFEANCEYGAAD